MPESLVLRLHGLPEMRLAGNARPGHYMAKARLITEDKGRWCNLLLEAGYVQREKPLFPGRVLIEAVLHFPTQRVPDEGNCRTGLKTLEDVLEANRCVFQLDRPMYTRGFAGIFGDDTLVEWGRVRRIPSSAEAPLTVLVVTDLEEAAEGLP